MRYPASEKLEIIRLVEESHLSARVTLAKLGIPRTTFYRWYDRYLQRGEAGLQDQSPKPKHVWNRVPDEVKRKVVEFALQETELSPRELAVTFTDQERYFISESTVYRVLKAQANSPSVISLPICRSAAFRSISASQRGGRPFRPSMPIKTSNGSPSAASLSSNGARRASSPSRLSTMIGQGVLFVIRPLLSKWSRDSIKPNPVI